MTGTGERCRAIVVPGYVLDTIEKDDCGFKHQAQVVL
jgi:hypothetical protein